MPTIDVATLVSNLVRALMALLGVFVVSQIIWGVFLKMTHGGNEDRIEKASTHMKHAVIGLVLVLTSAAVVPGIIKTLFAISGLAGDGI